MATYCAECGGDAIPHRLTYITILMDEVIGSVMRPGRFGRAVLRLASRVEYYLTPALLRAFTLLGLAKIYDRSDDKTLLLAQVLWKEADARGIEMKEVRLFNLARNIFTARYEDTQGRKRSIAFEGIPFPKGRMHVWWTDDKAELKPRFQKLGLPVAQGGAVATARGALALYRTLRAPVIVKPYSGSASRHTTLHIDSEEELLRAFRVATAVAPYAVIEEELVGPVYRATVVDGEFVALLRRDQPHVVGDGRHTVRELVEEANKNPARHGPYFHEMNLDDAALAELGWQGFTPESVPGEGARVTLHQKVNWSNGGTTADATEGVHQDNVALFERAAEVLQAPIIGMDFIIGDPTRSWKEQERSGVIECNSMPYFDNHHLPFEGEPRNVAGKIWDMVDAK